MKIPLLYLKSAPSNLSIANYRERIKILKFGDKTALFGYFWVRILKKAIVLFEISTLKFVKKEFLTHTVNFGIGVTFSEGPGSIFLKVSGTGPLYIVCR